MKRTPSALSLAFALLAAFPAAAELCPENEPCKVVVMPDTARVPLPFAGWLYPALEPPDNVAVVGPPQHGTFSGETYFPGANFWNAGLDQITVTIDEVPRTIVLVAANPIQTVEESEGFETLSGYQVVTPWNLVGTYAPVDANLGGAKALQVTGTASASILIDKDGAPIGTGGGLTIKPPPPCPECPFPPIDAFKMGPLAGAIARIQVRGLDDGTFQVRAVAAESLCEVGVVCETSFQSLVPEAVYDAWITVAPATLVGPSDSFTLRFNLKRKGEPVQHFELTDLPIPVLAANQWRVEGGLMGDSYGRQLVIDDIYSFRQDQSAEDVALTVGADRFTAAAMDHDWTQLGAVAISGSSNHVAQVDLVGLTNTASSRNSLVDYIASYKKRLRVQLNLDVNDIYLADNDSLVPFISYGNAATGGATRVVDLFVRKLSGVYYVRGRSVNDNGSVTSTDFLPLTGTNRIGLYWSSEAGGGRLQIAVDGTVGTSVSLANGARTAGNVGFGAHLVNVATPLPVNDRLLRLDDIAFAY
jgi:hypothetical protein